ncbi:T9SS type A sorting domain-containing protein [Flavobacterium restrictum]|uniref:T9SS type A sorting domain-containing protein n=1 Tax=Flavobacterium restrictum TaxID=2594428 RepID=A0A553EB31_9FLAO|nr:T9SS type A sorting domain-containing protein [Flavobacterium restrictum]TRX42155.1 T9SS type A sorting domain-containing protein [Flavobacterium restrictum]
MKRYLMLLCIGFSFTVSAQKISFEYDAAGNQISRTLCLSCTGKKATVIPKEIEAVTEKDLQKFTPNDVISYYPNPVKEELYLKWELANDAFVTTLMLYNFNGQVLNSYSKSKKEDTQTIPFQSYPSGTYLLVLNYNNGEQKTIKIIKQ